MDKVKSAGNCFGKCLKTISQGKVDTGLFYKNQKYYSTIYTGVISLLIMILVKYLVILACVDTFSMSFTETSIAQGTFEISNYNLSMFIEKLNPTLEVVTTDSDFCNTHNVVSFIICGSTYHHIYIECNLTANSSSYYQYNFTLRKNQTQGEEFLNDEFTMEIYVECQNSSICKDSTIQLIHEFQFDTYTFSSDGSLISERKKYQSKEISEGLVYKSIPIRKLKSESVVARWPSYNEDIYFTTEFDYPLNISSLNQTFQMKVSITDQTQLWTTVTSQPRTLSYLIMQIGGYIGILMLIGIFMGCFNYRMFQKEIKLTMLKPTQPSAEKEEKIEEVFSMEEFIRMKRFIDRLQSNPEFMRIFRETSTTVRESITTGRNSSNADDAVGDETYAELLKRPEISIN